MQIELFNGNCMDQMLFMADNSVDSIVTDPPYGLSFMGKKWDYDVPSVEIWAECLRVLKPGGHLLAFAGTQSQNGHAGFVGSGSVGPSVKRDTPATDAARQWQGWGTALKPALEPITVARKPLIGTVAANVLEHGTGALNIDGCRVGDFQNTTPSGVDRRNAALAEAGYRPGTYQMGDKTPDTPPGRWPANLIHDGSDDVVALFPNSDSPWIGNNNSGAKWGRMFGGGQQSVSEKPEYRGAGSAARFFYCAKASKKDRGEGNTHPTVKPTDLMRYLCRLVTPAGGAVFDPFMGSGSTGRAALLEGFNFVGAEMDEAFFSIAKARISAVQQGGS